MAKVIVKDKSGVVIREYSKEFHGDAYETLAEEFATSSGFITIREEDTMEETPKVEDIPADVVESHETPVEETPASESTETPAETPAEQA